MSQSRSEGANVLPVWSIKVHTVVVVCMEIEQWHVPKWYMISAHEWYTSSSVSLVFLLTLPPLLCFTPLTHFPTSFCHLPRPPRPNPTYTSRLHRKDTVQPAWRRYWQNYNRDSILWSASGVCMQLCVGLQLRELHFMISWNFPNLDWRNKGKGGEIVKLNFEGD